jgi:hypothetical protein
MHYYNALKAENYSSVTIDQSMIKRAIVSCALECKGSIEDIQAHLENIFNLHISEGSISNILSEAADKAKAFNESIRLDKIKIGVSDEIFQAGDPVLVGVDPICTFVYLMVPSEKRDSVSWWAAYCEKQENQGLNIEESITDGGLGMKKGIKEAYREIHEQYDIFHMLMKFTKAVNIYENKTYALINAEYNHEKKLLKTKPKTTMADYESVRLKASSGIEKYDKLIILISWLHELLNFGGYPYEDRLELLGFLLEEFGNLQINSKYLDEAIKTLNSNKEELLLFVKKAEKLFLELALKEDIRVDTISLFWQQHGVSKSQNEYWLLDSRLKSSLDNDYCRIKNKAEEILRTIVRCSSIVENINSQIRPYLLLKRTLKGKFLDLLQFYLNNRKYLNSRVKERIGKSPLELLTGKDYGNWLDILGY